MNWSNKHKEAENISVEHIEKISKKIMGEIETEYRFKTVNKLKFSKNELETGLTQSAIKLYAETVNASNPVYKKIQNLEANYSGYKSELDNLLYYDLKNYEKKNDEIERDLQEKRKEIDKLNEQKREIEDKFNKVENKTIHGHLSKIPSYWFFIIMFIVGLVELIIYKNVFLSQEIGLKADMSSEDQYKVEVMATVMAIGFTLMIVWMAHSLGSIVRHFPNSTRSEKWTNSFFIVVIIAVTALAIFSTVEIRGTMHEILAYDQKVTDIKEKIDRSADAIFGDDEEDDEEDESDFSVSDEDEEDMFSEEEDTSDVNKEVKEKPTALESQMDEYRAIVRIKKEETANVFMMINFFIFLSGVFLSYFSHTSSPVYEKILSSLKERKEEKEKLEKALTTIDKKIIKFKKNRVAPIFHKYLLEAAQYDLQARIYNAYIETFQMQLSIIEKYIKDIFEEKDAPYKNISSEEIIEKYISVAKRKELHNVHTNLEEYMIYNYMKPKEMTEEENIDV